MPRQVKAYACEFKCGHKIYTKRKSAIDHEKICFHNPIRKACQTCLHYKTETETIYNPHHNGNPGSTDYEAKFHYCAAREDVNLREQLQFNCPQWQAK